MSEDCTCNDIRKFANYMKLQANGFWNDWIEVDKSTTLSEAAKKELGDMASARADQLEVTEIKFMEFFPSCFTQKEIEGTKQMENVIDTIMEKAGLEK